MLAGKIPLLLICLILPGCQKKNEFTGSSARVEQPTEEPPVTGPPTEKPPVDPPNVKPPVEPPCQDHEIPRGIHVGFLVDNSQSTLETDCPDEAFGRCGSMTNREKSILTVFDALQGAAEKGDEEISMSTLSLGRFTAGGLFSRNGYGDVLEGLETRAGNRDRVADGLLFNRQPTGYTPWLQAAGLGQTLFERTPEDGKRRIAILVTDGEPTDAEPDEVITAFGGLAQQGVRLIAVVVNGGKSREERTRDHAAYMWDVERYQRGNSDQQRFDQEYFPALSSLPERIFGESIHEVAHSDGLSSMLSKIIETELQCR